MNIVISDKLFRKLIETVADLESELNEAQSYCTWQGDVDSLEARIIDLQALGALCRRIEEYQKKNPCKQVQVSPGTLAQLRRRK